MQLTTKTKSFRRSLRQPKAPARRASEPRQRASALSVSQVRARRGGGIERRSVRRTFSREREYFVVAAILSVWPPEQSQQSGRALQCRDIAEFNEDCVRPNATRPRHFRRRPCAREGVVAAFRKRIARQVSIIADDRGWARFGDLPSRLCHRSDEIIFGGDE